MNTKVFRFAAVLFVATSCGVFAQGTAFTYQGRLNDGPNPAHGSYDLQFTLYAAASGGSAVAGPLASAPTGVSNGLFTVTLDFGVGAFTGADRWLQVGVRTNGSVAAHQVLSPRQQLTSTPYATRAANATSYTGAVSDGQLSGNIARLNANQTFSGAVNFNNQANTYNGTFSGNGAGLTDVPGTLPVQVVAGTNVLAQSNRAYDATNTALVTATLPATANVGDIVQVNGLGTGGWQIGTTSGQTINGFQAGLSWTAQPGAPSQAYYSLASSADGTKLVAGTFSGLLFTSTNSGVSWVLQPGAPVGGDWSSGQAIASSADGSKLVAAPNHGQIFTSTNGGVSWTARANSQSWRSVASSDDGTKLVAVAAGQVSILSEGSLSGQIYTSTNSGATWLARPYSKSWTSVASSADGTKLVAVAMGDINSFLSNGEIFTSTNSGATWTGRGYFAEWQAVASSSDGTRLVAVALGGQIHTSSDSGVTWTARPYVAAWQSVASSADGTKLVAVAGGSSSGQIYFSTDSGVTWRLSSGAPAARWQCVRSSADGNKFVAGFDGNANTGQIFTSVPTPVAGGQGTSATLQYAGNGVWQALNLPSTTGRPNTLVMRDADGRITAGAISAGTIAISGNNTLEFGAGVPGKELNAGKIGYQTFTADALDIVGAGTSGANRKLRFWSEGGATFAGAVNATSFTGAGSNLTSLNASQLTTGTVPDARLSTNVAVRSGGNDFIGNQNFSGGIITLDNAQDIYAKNSSGVAEGLLVGRWFDNSTYFTYGTGGLIIRNNANAFNMVIQNDGNVGIGTSTPGEKLHVAGNILATGTITPNSDRNAKTNIQPVDNAAILEQVAALPIKQWRFKTEDAAVKHVGPMAQDFHAAFGLGAHETAIATVDADGVALAAIQGLNQKLEKQKAENAELKKRLSEIEALLGKLAPKKD